MTPTKEVNAELEETIRRLQRQIEGHAERIVAQSELLSRRAATTP